MAVDPAVGFALALLVARREQADGQEVIGLQQVVEGVDALGEQAAGAGAVVVFAARSSVVQFAGAVMGQRSQHHGALVFSAVFVGRVGQPHHRQVRCVFSADGGLQGRQVHAHPGVEAGQQGFLLGCAIGVLVFEQAIGEQARVTGLNDGGGLPAAVVAFVAGDAVRGQMQATVEQQSVALDGAGDVTAQQDLLQQRQKCIRGSGHGRA